jgi:hypothetical protein
MGNRTLIGKNQHSFPLMQNSNFDSLEREILTVEKRNFDSLKREIFDSLQKGNFDSLKKKILTVWKGKF